MNCLEFRRRVAAEPDLASDGLREHIRHCAACRQFRDELLELDCRLRSALLTPVADDLAARILLAQSTLSRRRQQRRRWLALAASVLLVTSLAVFFTSHETARPLDEIVVAHIEAEVAHLSERRDVPMTQLQHVLARVGQHLHGDIGPVNYAGVCPIGRHEGAHLVVDGRQGPVTVLILPETRVVERRVIERDGWHGLILPARQGSMAIVGKPGEELEAVARRILGRLGQVS